MLVSVCFLNILFFSCVCLFVPGVYVIKIIIIIITLLYSIRSHNFENKLLSKLLYVGTLIYILYNLYIYNICL